MVLICTTHATRKVFPFVLNIVLYRTELLLDKGYEVHGIIRRSSSFNTGRLHHLYEDQHERKSALHFCIPTISYCP